MLWTENQHGLNDKWCAEEDTTICKRLMEKNLIYHFEKAQVVSERCQNADEGDDEHDHTEHNEHNGRSQEDSFQSFVLLPLHLRINTNGQNKAPYELKQTTQIR